MESKSDPVKDLLGNVSGILESVLSPDSKKDDAASQDILNAMLPLINSMFVSKPKETTDDIIPTPEDLGFVSPLRYVVTQIKTHSWVFGEPMTIKRDPHPVRELTEQELRTLLSKGWKCEQFSTYLTVTPNDA